MNTVAIDATSEARPIERVKARGRIEAIDLARGFAVTLMILSHGVNGLMPLSAVPDWGAVPIHVATKFSSSLFFIVFGVALAVAFVPKTQSPDWSERRNRLLIRGLVVLFWYKVLTIVEMYDAHESAAIVRTLLYQDFPSFVEILGFYAIALLIVPWFLPLWARLPALVRWTSPAVLALLSWWLLKNFNFWGVPQVQAVLVEHPDYYTWGQLSRMPLVLLGLLIGGLLRDRYHRPARGSGLAMAIAAVAVALLFAFVLLAGDDRAEILRGIAGNDGKHPPELMFMLYSVGGALLLLAVAIAGRDWLARALKPIAIIGSDALMAFIFHITVIFVLYRDVLGYYRSVSYPYALSLTIVLIGATSLWIWSWQRARLAFRKS